MHLTAKSVYELERRPQFWAAAQTIIIACVTFRTTKGRAYRRVIDAYHDGLFQSWGSCTIRPQG